MNKYSDSIVRRWYKKWNASIFPETEVAKLPLVKSLPFMIEALKTKPDLIEYSIAGVINGYMEDVAEQAREEEKRMCIAKLRALCAPKNLHDREVILECINKLEGD